jgi:murein tripeptide amidase MpaA
MWINSSFDGGNIEVLEAADAGDIKLAIRKDGAADFLQWFYFRIGGVRGTALKMSIVNASASSYPKGWEDYRAVASYDRGDWFRVETTYDGTNLVIEHVPEADVMEVAYFAPYGLDRQRDVLARLQGRQGVGLDALGETCDGRALDIVTIGTGPLACWFIARQHPGETQASWWMEGFLDRLSDADDALVRWLKARATFYVVPNMNPDGSFRGHLRTNAQGANLNREWQEPTLEKSPEVFLTRRRMGETGVDFLLDVHGDEALPYNFIAGPHGVPDLPDHVLAVHDRFCDALKTANPDFQTEVGYPAAGAGKALLTMASKHVAHTFGCLAMTLEQPFKDSAISPDGRNGWSPGRCINLGWSCLDALAAVIDDLRPDGHGR